MASETFDVENVALQSKTIKHTVEDLNDSNQETPLPNVTGNILSKVIEYCNKHADTPNSDDELMEGFKQFLEVDQNTLFDLNLSSMASNNNNNSAFYLHNFLEKDKLNHENFLDWERNLRIVLRAAGRESVLETHIPKLPKNACQADKTARQTLIDRSVPITCLMLTCMETDFQKLFNDMDAHTIIQQLRTMFRKDARLERFETHCKLLECKLEKGKSVGPHVFNMIGQFEHMTKLGFPYPQELATDMIINSLTPAYKNICLNLYMQGGEVTMQELYGMLIQVERSLPNEQIQEHKDNLKVQKGKGFKRYGVPTKKDKGKCKKVDVSNTLDKPKATSKTKVVAQHECYYCYKVGHWKRNCPKYLEDKKAGVSS